MAVIGQELGKQLCDAFGLDSTKVLGLTLRVYPNEIATLVCEYAPDAGEVTSVLTQYALVESRQFSDDQIAKVFSIPADKLK